MNDLKETIEALMPLLIIAVTVIMYILVVQLVNDSTCAAMELPGSQALGKGIIKVLALCW